MGIEEKSRMPGHALYLARPFSIAQHRRTRYIAQRNMTERIEAIATVVLESSCFCHCSHHTSLHVSFIYIYGAFCLMNMFYQFYSFVAS